MTHDFTKRGSNAVSQPMTVADGVNTFGILNQRPSTPMSYQIGVYEEQGCRPTMEDTHAFIVDLDGVRGQGYFGVFDGHGNKEVAEWCGSHFQDHFLSAIHKDRNRGAEEILSAAFKSADDALQALSEKSDKVAESGSTAVVAFLRMEDANGKQAVFAPSPQDKPPISPPASARPVLYCANAGDARAVISRKGRAQRLTQDHKATDKDEQSRIRNAGGIVFRGRVFGTLAISRSLGDHLSYEGLHLKELVIGTPYVSRTPLEDSDEFCIIACDGLWDEVSDQEAVDAIKDIKSAQEASELLVALALEKGSTDNCTVMVVRFKDFLSPAQLAIQAAQDYLALSNIA